MIHVIVPLEAEPKQGDRSRIVTGKGKSFVAHYQPAKVKQFSRNLAALLAPHRPKEPLDGPVCIEIVFGYPWPASASKRSREAGIAPKTTKPDLDNLEKAIMDVLQSSGFIVNDSRNWIKRTAKPYCRQGFISLKLWVSDDVPSWVADAVAANLENGK